MADGKLNLDKIAHVCIVVADIDKSVERYWKDFGIGSWRIVTGGSGDCTGETTYYGQPCTFRFRSARTDTGGLTLELMQHLEGQTIYKDHLETKGEGVHHLGILVDDLDEAQAKMELMGYRAIMTVRGWGKSHDGDFAYMDTADELGVIYELVKTPTQRFDPDGFYPRQ